MERPQEKQTVQAPQEPARQDPKGTQKTPQRSLIKKGNIWNCKQFLPKRDNERSQKADQHPTQPQTPTSLPAASPQITGEADTTVPSKSSTDTAAAAQFTKRAIGPQGQCTIIVQPETSTTVTASHTSTREGYPGYRCVIHTLPSSHSANQQQPPKPEQLSGQGDTDRGIHAC